MTRTRTFAEAELLRLTDENMKLRARLEAAEAENERRRRVIATIAKATDALPQLLERLQETGKT